ncbi:MAG: oxidoreductase [Nocardioides sp.]|nr:oxidoreductase [Nocardioides sp.]
MAPRRLYALFGILATLVGMAVGHLVAALTSPDSSPVLAVGSAVIRMTPTPVKEWAIRTFESDGFSILFIDFPAQNYDKVVLVGSVFIGVIVLAALAGVLARSSFRLGAGALVALVVVALVLTLTAPSPSALDVVPAILTAVAGVAALWVLDRTARGLPLDPRAVSTAERAKAEAREGSGDAADDTAEPASGPRSASRRGVLIASGATLAVAAVVGGLGRFIGNLRTRAEDVVLPQPASGEAAAALPKDLSSTYDISPLRVPNADFYRVDTRLDTPVVDSGSWTLTVDGDVENELEISFEELLAMPMVERDITLTCVSNSVGGKYVGGARWLGVPLNDVLEMAGVGTTADQILSTDFDGMTISTPLSVATDGRDALIAVGMNGEPLPRAHGFPVRLVIPGLYGFVGSTKWVTRLTLTTYAEQQAYWTERDWATDAPIKPSARIDPPRALEQVSAGSKGADPGAIVVGGVAWAQNDGGVSKVQVQVDGGPWTDAETGPDVGDVYWRQWFLQVDGLESGQHQAKARVVDGDGDVQTDVRAQPFPEGSSGIHTVIFTVG